MKFLEITDRKLKEYVQKIIKGEITACKWVKNACKRFVNDFDNPALIYDVNAASHVIEFFEKYCCHIKGEWAGQKLILEPWERFILSNIFGWKQLSNGLRRFRTAYIETGRKNGKSLMLSGIGNYCLLADGESGAEIYSAATKIKQAEIVFDIAKRMIRKSSALNRKVTINKLNLSVEETASKFEPVTSDSETLDGLNISCGLLDELHAHPNRGLWDIFETATGARRQPLQIAITTAGFDRETICWQIHDYIEKILDKVIEDDTFFGMIFAIDDNDRKDWDNEKIWIKANPNLGISVKLEDLQRKCKRAKEMPSQLNAFLQKHLDVWTEAAEIWIPLEKWDLCFREIEEKGLEGLTCYAGLDLSSRLDVSALSYVFPPQIDDFYRIIFRFFIPADNMVERVKRDRVPYDIWSRQGYINITPGNVIDYGFIHNQIMQDTKKFNVMSLSFDPYGATRFIQDLQGLGFDDPKENKHAERYIIEIRHTYTNFTVPIKDCEKMIMAQEILIQRNPVMRWMASNIVLKAGPAGGLMPDKTKSREKIDGIIALLMGLARASMHEEATMPLISVI